MWGSRIHFHAFQFNLHMMIYDGRMYERVFIRILTLTLCDKTDWLLVFFKLTCGITKTCFKNKLCMCLYRIMQNGKNAMRPSTPQMPHVVKFSHVNADMEKVYIFHLRLYLAFTWTGKAKHVKTFPHSPARFLAYDWFNYMNLMKCLK